MLAWLIEITFYDIRGFKRNSWNGVKGEYNVQARNSLTLWNPIPFLNSNLNAAFHVQQ